MPISFDAIAQFFKDRAADLLRIVRAAKGDVELPEVQSEVWLAAGVIEKQRGKAMNLADIADQEALLGKVYTKLVTYAEKKFHFAVRLDIEDSEENPSYGATLAKILAAPDTSDPQIAMERGLDGDEIVMAMRRSYSEATAYVVLLMRFRWDSRPLAEHLCLALATLRLRFRRAADRVQTEPSLFDGVCQIANDFQPTVGATKTGPYSAHLVGDQHSWSF